MHLLYIHQVYLSITQSQPDAYNLHNRQGQLFGFHFFISVLKDATDSNVLKLSGMSSQILGPRHDSVSDPK